jgi:hypothetical protein
MLKSKNDNSLALDEAIERLLNRMQYVEVDSEEYGTMVSRLDKLYAMKNTNRNRVSKDAIWTIGANILGIILILGHERANVVTSKALSFIVKPKI